MVRFLSRDLQSCQKVELRRNFRAAALLRDGVKGLPLGPHRGTAIIMVSQGFSFPPPPPPPPSSTQQPSAYPSAHSGQHWNARGSGGRGRGRGHGNRGRGGGHFSSDNNRSQYSNPPGYNYAAGNYGYPAQPQPVATTSYMPPTPTPPPPYPHTQANFQHPQTPPTYQPSQNYSQPAGAAAYQRLPGYNNGPTANLAHTAPYPTQATPPYPPSVPSPQHGPPSNNPMIMGSPWGGPPAPHGRGGWPSHAHGNHGAKPRHHNSNKRDHTSAFSKPQSSVPRTPAPPPVPSFGNPLPSKPPPAADATRKPKKRKRKHNQLGLTPKTDDHESSEEEEDVDEESKLAQTSADAAAPLQFSYRGQTATLQSQSDIAAWIAERKKRFPTQARIDEKKKAADEAKAARDAARLEKQKEREKDKEKHKAKQQAPPPMSTGEAAAKSDPVLDAAMKAQRKAEKIKRNLDREQKRFAKAEAEAEAARLKVEALQRQAQGLMDKESAQEQTGVPATEPPGVPLVAGTGGVATIEEISKAPESLSGETTTSVPIPVSVSIPAAAIDAATNLVDPQLDLDSEGSGISDWTSSSGSGSDSDSEADSDSGSDDNDSAPEEVSSRREGPERVPAPPREGKKVVCRHFARSGRCNRGDQCKFSHEVSGKGPKAKPAEKEKKGRKGLLQALLERQKDDEDRRAMEVISWLGQNGHLAALSGDAASVSANAAANPDANVHDNANVTVDGSADVRASALATSAPQSDTPV
ncbi:CCCH zinc finger protein [Penicillium brasilianum]|uniref:CCCH zinc finger protein n=1 Tax=Penicillium brasilianum TaxID=104259 RepID=A0A1S9RH23_PENBI|nr:CCCH zinc finger protein [Penicillium brasilianum]